MRYADFVSAYDRIATVSSHHVADRENLLRAPRAYSEAFGSALHDHLASRPQETSPEEFVRFLREYDRWNTEHFVTTANALNSDLGDGDPYSSLIALHFHSLNRPMVENWPALLFGSSAPDRFRQREMQIAIALHAWGIVRARERALAEIDYYGAEHEGLRRAQTGLLTESDTAIVLLELTRMNPHLLIVPAPLQFEACAPGHNIDFLVIDRAAESVVGIQAKTNVTRLTHRRYADGIVLIDGSVDLGNMRRLRRRHGSSSTSVVAWPGLISMHFLASARLDSPGFRLYAPRIQPRQRFAKRATYGTRNYLVNAVAHVSARILPLT